MRSEIVKRARIELAKRDFFAYLNLTAPDFYRYDRPFLKTIADELQQFVEGEEHNVLVMNVPPRHGKSRTGSAFTQWLLGVRPSTKIMTASYNETLSQTFSKSVRNTISEVKADERRVVYSDIFKNVRIKRGDASMNRWSLEGQYSTYLATSPKGTTTGFGADIQIFDDLVKNALEANNARVLSEHWSWFTDTMLSRLENGGKIIIVMTRWSSNDLAGRVLKTLPDLGYRVKHINMKALQDDGTMLCESILSEEDYLAKTSVMSEDIASANYQQEPIDLKGQLYSEWQTYESLPRAFERIVSYCDTADEGSDYLANIIAVSTATHDYVVDVIYTQRPMEETEQEVAASIAFYGQSVEAVFESNNGGKMYARAVERHIAESHGLDVSVEWFHQSENKDARILTYAPTVQRRVVMPSDWEKRWPEFHEALTTYQRAGKNLHDDAPDALTGLVEQTTAKGGEIIGGVSPYGKKFR